jgi:hypothetical protein
MQNLGVKKGYSVGGVGIITRHCQKNEGVLVVAGMNEEMSTKLFSICDRRGVSGNRMEQVEWFMVSRSSREGLSASLITQ